MNDVISISNVSKKFRYKRKDFYAVSDVSFNVKQGEIFGLLGPNGAGKTTLLNMIVGVLAPDSGSISVFDEDLRQDRSMLEQISLSSGGTNFHWAMRTKDVLNFYARIYGIDKEEREKRIKKLIQFFDLEKFIERKIGYLSTGEKMRLMFAKSLLNHPKLLLLDEPTLGLDPDIALKVREEIKRINRKFGTTIVLTSHYMAEVEQLCTRIAFINKGRIVDIGDIEKVKVKQFSTYNIFLKVRKIKDKAFLKRHGFKINGSTIEKKLRIDENISEILSLLAKRKIEIIDIESRKPTLEDYFVKILGEKK